MSEDRIKTVFILENMDRLVCYPSERTLLDVLDLDQFTGTEHYYKHFTGLLYTDGIKYLADKAECYWFIDVVASYQYKFKDVHFQIWKLRITKGGRGLVTMSKDIDEPILVSQWMDYTDFPLDEIEVYCIDNVMLLKSEH